MAAWRRIYHALVLVPISARRLVGILHCRVRSWNVQPRSSLCDVFGNISKLADQHGSTGVSREFHVEIKTLSLFPCLWHCKGRNVHAIMVFNGGIWTQIGICYLASIVVSVSECMLVAAPFKPDFVMGKTSKILHVWFHASRLQ